jgi:putative membrane protein (TIGR04086 family)
MRKKETGSEEVQVLQSAMWIWIGVFVSFGICILCLVVFSIGTSGGLLSKAWMKNLTLVACFLGSGAGGWLKAQRNKGYRLISGVMVGGGLFLMIMAIGRIFYQQSALDYVLAFGCLCGGTASGLLVGVKRGKRGRKALNKKR